MAEDTQKQAPDTPALPDDKREALIQSAQGGNTATGKAQATLEDDNSGRVEENRGSTQPIVGGEPQPTADAPENVGMQTQPAAFTVNGSLPVAHVASPAGLVPVSTVAATPEEANKKLQEHYDSIQAKPRVHEGFKRVSRSQVANASAAELRAAAHDRGWDLGEEAGARVTRARFLAKQNEELGSEEDSEDTSTTAAE